MYKRILVAVSDDPQVDTPVQCAIALAAFTGAELWFLRVLTMPLCACESATAASTTQVLESVTQANASLLDCAMTAADAAGVSYTVTQRWGAIPDMILQTAEEADCDLIVVGSPGCSRWRRFLCGYVASPVLAAVQRPVLVVGPAPARLPLPGTALWSRLLVVTDETHWADVASEYALTLARAAALDVSLLRIVTGSRTAAAAPVSALLPTVPSTMAGGGDEAIQRPAGSLAQTILETAARRHCDAIILGSCGVRGWKRWRYRRVARLVIARSRLPVLLVNRSQED